MDFGRGKFGKEYGHDADSATAGSGIQRRLRILPAAACFINLLICQFYVFFEAQTAFMHAFAVL